VNAIGRRALLELAAGVLTVPSALGGSVAAERWSETIVVNALGGLGDPNLSSSGDPGAPDEWAQGSRVLREAHASGLTGAGLLRRGYSTGRIEKILGQNFVRYRRTSGEARRLRCVWRKSE